MRERGTSRCVYEAANGWGAVVAGERGLLEVYLPFEVATRAELIRRITDDYPNAAEAPAGSVAQVAAERLARFFVGEAVGFDDLPVDAECFSLFQRDVYRVVSAIPSGRVLTYAAVATALGKPRGARGIGSAMGRNPLPIIIPCHRVVGSTGAMTGYSAPGGVGSKQWLLRHEGVALTEKGRVEAR